MREILNSINAKVPQAEDEYMGDDGLLHCSKCKTPVQTRIHIFGTDRVVRCVCGCVIAEREAEAERTRQQEISRQKMICFAESNMASWTFDNDDGNNAKLTEVMQNYVANFDAFRKDGKGLLLYGSVGTGKTYYASCIANALIEDGYSVLMTNFARLTNQLQGMFEGRQEYIDNLNKYSLLIIDDLGAERKSEYMQEMVFNIIDARYRAGLPMIITTNLSADELKKPQDVAYQRIYDRVLERCHPVKVDGQSRRREMLKSDFEKTQKMLGL